jgi:hypothetical protein
MHYSFDIITDCRQSESSAVVEDACRALLQAQEKGIRWIKPFPAHLPSGSPRCDLHPTPLHSEADLLLAHSSSDFSLQTYASVAARAPREVALLVSQVASAYADVLENTVCPSAVGIASEQVEATPEPAVAASGSSTAASYALAQPATAVPTDAEEWERVRSLVDFALGVSTGLHGPLAYGPDQITAEIRRHNASGARFVLDLDSLSRAIQDAVRRLLPNHNFYFTRT